MSKNLYEAAILQLRGRALESLAALELLFQNPTAIPDHTAWVDEIVKHTKRLAENENTMITLQQYFGKRFAPPPQPQAVVPPGPPKPPSDPLVVTPERSPTLKRELDRQKMMEAAKARRAEMAKKELYPKSAEESGLQEEEPKKKPTRKARKKAKAKETDVE